MSAFRNLLEIVIQTVWNTTSSEGLLKQDSWGYILKSITHLGTDVSELNYMDVMIMLVSEFKFHGISVNKLTKERASNCLFTNCSVLHMSNMDPIYTRHNFWLFQMDFEFITFSTYFFNNPIIFKHLEIDTRLLHSHLLHKPCFDNNAN